VTLDTIPGAFEKTGGADLCDQEEYRKRADAHFATRLAT
jgi:hypothetical protein